MKTSLLVTGKVPRRNSQSYHRLNGQVSKFVIAQLVFSDPQLGIAHPQYIREVLVVPIASFARGYNSLIDPVEVVGERLSLHLWLAEQSYACLSPRLSARSFEEIRLLDEEALRDVELLLPGADQDKQGRRVIHAGLALDLESSRAAVSQVAVSARDRVGMDKMILRMQGLMYEPQ